MSICWSVGPSVRRSVSNAFVWAAETSRRTSYFVYTNLLIPLYLFFFLLQLFPILAMRAIHLRQICRQIQSAVQVQLKMTLKMRKRGAVREKTTSTLQRTQKSFSFVK